ncbi:MAG: hypothetical protein MUF72_16225 [Elainella sp. Prado103]|nr:hypothetical protein [Elainella sp. Prado103]
MVGVVEGRLTWTIRIDQPSQLTAGIDPLDFSNLAFLHLFAARTHF